MMVHVHGIAYILLLFLQGSPAVLFRKNGRVVEGNALLTRQSPKAARRFESCFFRISLRKVKPFKSDKKWQKLSIMPRRIPLSELIPSMPYRSPTARSRLTFELSRQTGLRRTPSSARLSTYGAQEAKGQYIPLHSCVPSVASGRAER